MAIEFEPIDGIDQPSADTPPKGEEPKRGRGRPRSADNGSGPTTKPRLTAQDKKNVEAALASMASLYTIASMGTLALQRPQTANLIIQQTEQWQTGNRQAFEASPSLAARIASAGQVSGTLIFAVTNMMAAGTVLMAIREETALIRAQRAAQEPTPEEGPLY